MFVLQKLCCLHRHVCGSLTSDNNLAFFAEHHVNLQQHLSNGLLYTRACTHQSSVFCSHYSEGTVMTVVTALPRSGRIFSLPVILMPVPSCTERKRQDIQQHRNHSFLPTHRLWHREEVPWECCVVTKVLMSASVL